MNQTKFTVSDDDFWYQIRDALGDGGGVYLLHCEAHDGSTVKIPRCTAVDERGVLYIGKADSFLDRVIELKKSISPNYSSSSHECGVRYKLSSAISEAFPFSRLYVSLIPSSGPRKLESKLLTEYLIQFGELPPLNRSA